MLELIFQGLIEWLYGLILEAWEYFFSVFMDVLNVDFDYLVDHIDVIPEIMHILLAVGWALLLGNLVFQATKSMMTGLGFEGEDPRQLFTRTFVFAFLLVASPQVCDIGLNITARIITLLDAVDAGSVNLIGEGAFGGIAAEWLLIIVINIILMFKVFRLLLEIVERYLVLALLTICAPLAFGMGGSKNTSDIFTGWCRMFASMCFVMVSNMIFFKLLLSLLGNVPTGLDVFLWIALVFGVVKVAQKVDGIITRIGLNPAMTGGGLGGRGLPGMLAYTVVRSMASQVVRTAGNNAGSTQSGPGSGSGAGASGGKPNFRGPTGGGTAAKDAPSGKPGAGQRNHTFNQSSSKSSTQQSTASQSSTKSTAQTAGGKSWNTAGHPVSVTPDDSETAAMEGGAPITNLNTQAQSSDTSGKGPERRSSVPPGTVRSPSHVKQGGGAKVSGASTNNVKNSSANSSRNTSVRPGQAQPGAAARARKDGTTGMRAGLGSGGAPRPGTAGTGAGSQNRAAAIHGIASRPGTAGTGGGSSERTVHGGAQAPTNGTAGTGGTQTATRFTNAPRVAQNQAVQNSVQAAQQSAVTLEGAKQTPAGSAGRTPPPTAPGSGAPSSSKDSRFTQRPAAVQPAQSGIGSQPGTAGIAPAAQSAQSGQTPKESQRMGNVPNGAPVPTMGQASTPAQQESRITHPGGTGSGARQPSRASARQESRDQRAKSAPNDASRTARPSGAGDGGKRRVSTTASARQERRVTARNPSAVKGMASVQHPGTTGTAPPAARPSRKCQDETRPPKPKENASDVKENTNGADAIPAESEKEGGGDE